MTRLLSLAALLFTVALLSAQPLTDAEKADGFVPLFDGKSFEGWKTTDSTPKSWKVENGLLILTGGGSSLYTKDEFADFIVRFEWRPLKKGYNSGFFIRGSNQIQMQQANCGHLMSNTKETKGVPMLHKEPGEWNEWEVVCIGGSKSSRRSEVTSLPADDAIAWAIAAPRLFLLSRW